MHTEDEFLKLASEEGQLTDEEIAFLLTVLTDAKANIIREVESFYRKYGKDGIVTYTEARKYVSAKERKRRMLVLFLAIKAILHDAIANISARVANFMDILAATEYEFFDSEIPEDSPNEVAWGVGELTWRERLLEDEELWLAYLLTQLRQAWIRRQTIDDVIAIIDGRFGTMENALARLVDTEVTALTSDVRRRIFRDLGIEEYEFYTRVDERRCEVCGSMHGMRFPITQYEVGVTAPPMHPRCRCWTVPVTD